MQIIETGDYRLELGPITESSFSEVLAQFETRKKLIIVDENTHEFCLDFLLTGFESLSEAEVIIIPSGEENKELEVVINVWKVLTEFGISRHDLIINLGGGLVTDTGGFIASCYKRGVRFINIPTSLLGMVDASVGGKTGVNLGVYKNQIGIFNHPIALYIDPVFLESLPDMEVMSGYAEMFKHGLIHSEELFTEVLEQVEAEEIISLDLLKKCIEVKNEVVKNDPRESGPRKVLNFGHTFGHVIEGQYLGSAGMKHGYAVGIGMMMETYLSMRRGLLSKDVFQKIETTLLKYYPLPPFSDEDIKVMVAMMLNDKKNDEGNILSCLLEGYGKCTFDHKISIQEATEVFIHYKSRQVNLN